MAVVWNWLALCCFTVLVSSAFGSECDTASVLDRIYGQYTDNTLAEGWYKVPRHELADDPLKSGDCATKYPIWGSGQFPDDGMESDVTACVVSETKSCARNFTIRVKDCDDKFEVYYLKPTSSSDEAYCFKHDDEDDDDDDDCEERRHHGKKFHKCHRNSRHFVVVIGIVVLVIAAVAIAAFIIYRRRKAAILKRQDMYKDKEAPTDNGPVVVTTDGGLPPKKY